MTKEKEIRLRMAKLKLDFAQRELDRGERLNRESLSESELDLLRINRDLAQCEVELAASGIEL